MKVICIQGSPRKKGNTSTILGWVEEELRGLGHQVERIHIVDRKIKGCTGCYKCKLDPEKLYCSRRDDGVGLFKRMKRADAIVYATPLYCWGFTSQMKALIDRHICLVTGYPDPSTHRSHLEGKRVALLVTAEGHAGRGNTDLITELFRRLADYVKTVPAAELIVPSCTEPKKLGEKHRKMACAFAKQVAG